MRTRMLAGHHLSIAEACTIDEFRDRMIRFARSLEFDMVSAMAVVDHSTTHTGFHYIDNTPDAFRDRWIDPAVSRVDPVMQHCKRSSVPIVWDQATYVSKGLVEIWEEQASYGFKTGVCVALHLPGDRHFCLGVDRDRPFAHEPKALTKLVADLQLFAVHAHEAALHIFAPARADSSSHEPGLTALELEALRWTMDGQSAWGVGKALNISERSAEFHLLHATRKLGCASRFEAVLKAIRLGLLA